MAGLANPEARRTSAQRLLWLGSGLLVTFAAVGFGAWLSGAASWVGFYLGARGGTLTGLAQATICVGFGLAVLGTLAWYRRRCGRGATDIPARAVLAACLAMPAGNISWAIFVDAVAYHYGEDIVRPAVDFALMYLVLGALPPLALGVPWLVWRLRRAAPTSESPPVPAWGGARFHTAAARLGTATHVIPRRLADEGPRSSDALSLRVPSVAVAPSG